MVRGVGQWANAMRVSLATTVGAAGIEAMVSLCDQMGMQPIGLESGTHLWGEVGAVSSRALLEWMQRFRVSVSGLQAARQIEERALGWIETQGSLAGVDCSPEIINPLQGHARPRLRFRFLPRVRVSAWRHQAAREESSSGLQGSRTSFHWGRRSAALRARGFVVR